MATASFHSDMLERHVPILRRYHVLWAKLTLHDHLLGEPSVMYFHAESRLQGHNCKLFFFLLSDNSLLDVPDLSWKIPKHKGMRKSSAPWSWPVWFQPEGVRLSCVHSLIALTSNITSNPKFP